MRRTVYRGPRPRDRSSEYSEINKKVFLQMVKVICKSVSKDKGAGSMRIILGRDDDGLIWFCNNHFAVKITEELFVEAAGQNRTTQKVLMAVPSEPREVIELQRGEVINEGKEADLFGLFSDLEERIKEGNQVRLYPTPYCLYAKNIPAYIQSHMSGVFQFDPFGPKMQVDLQGSIFLQLDFLQTVDEKYWELIYSTEKPKKGTKKNTVAWVHRAVFVHRAEGGPPVAVMMPVKHGPAEHFYETFRQELPLTQGK